MSFFDYTANDFNWIHNYRLTAIVGHYGCGKTEFAFNLALMLAEQGRKKTALADLDIVNPYFRSRERQDILFKNGIQLISTSSIHSDADVPALPPKLNSLIQNEDNSGVLDIGGDAVGARILARYRHLLQNTSFGMYFVLNANRPAVSTADKAIISIRQIEKASGIRVAGIVNNTHLCNETTSQDIIKGYHLSSLVSEKMNIQLICNVVPLNLAEETDIQKLFPISIYMKKPWEQAF